MGLNFANSTSISGFVSDFWRYTAAHQGNTVLTANNWERPDTHNQGYVGGMSQSSGTFSFPATGIYLVSFTAYMYIHNVTTKSQRCSAFIQQTTDNSNYTQAASSATNFGGGGYSTSLNTDSSATAQAMFDITDISNQKVQFGFGAGQGFEYVGGSSSGNSTFAIFTKVGDT